MKGWRLENQVDAILSACSTLIARNRDQRFENLLSSLISVKEHLAFLITFGSPRLETSATITLPFDGCPYLSLARSYYAAQHWVDHAKDEDVSLRFQGPMEQKPFTLAFTFSKEAKATRGNSVVPWELYFTFEFEHSEGC